jgi:hypothetical protein
MAIGNRKASNWLHWLLVGGAFVAVLGTAGCARFKTMFGRCHCPSTDAPPAAIAQADADDVTAEFAQQAPPSVSELVGPVDSAPPAVSAPVVNLFGEFEGNAKPVKSAGERSVSAAGFQQHTFLDEGYDGDVAVDPTGKWLAFASTRHSENADLYLQKVNGLSVVQLTNDDAADPRSVA